VYFSDHKENGKGYWIGNFLKDLRSQKGRRNNFCTRRGMINLLKMLV
jgi:hypothetical protein